jgi:hypothetical protein
VENILLEEDRAFFLSSFQCFGSGIRCLFDPLDPGCVKKSGSGMNNSDHISESSETVFWVKILKFFDADPGYKKFGSGMEKFGSGINIPVPQHCLFFNSNPFACHLAQANYTERSKSQREAVLRICDILVRIRTFEFD